MKVCAPYLPANEPEIKFETYRYYLDCFRSYLQNLYGSWRDFGRVAIKHSNKIQGSVDFDKQWIERHLKIAWNTEYLTSVGFNDYELLRINNQWLPIQCYYAVYGAAEALSYVLDGNKANSHQKALRKTTEFFIRSGLDPWNKAFKGAIGKKRNEHEAVNFPSNIEIPHNLQRVGVVPLQMIAKCLKAEHANRVDDIWNKSTGIYKYKYNPGSTGLLHFLYKLRIKSNYKEVDCFVCDAPEENVRSFSQSVCFLCFWNLLYMEILLIRKCKKKFIIELGQNYLRTNPHANHLEERLAFYRNEI